jgi:hypothetical protein
MTPDWRDVARLLARAGQDESGPAELVQLPGGRNNRVFRVDTGTGPFALKAYFSRPGDPRDRLDAEFRFCEFAWTRGVRAVPEPLARDDPARLGLYEFIDGRRVAPAEVGAGHVEAALALVRDLNAHAATDASAMALPVGSEACFSLAAHLETVGQRIQRLNAIDPKQGVDRRAARFVAEILKPAWQGVERRVRRDAARAGIDAGAELPPSERCISPSDFGFHNALVERDGEIRFIDFEYAGWDHPAKLICDFFCQPAVPVPLEHLDRFADEVLACTDGPGRRRIEVDLLLDVYRLKWICILLNDFLPGGADRRGFALGEAELEPRKAEQLAKATAAIQAIQTIETVL